MSDYYKHNSLFLLRLHMKIILIFTTFYRKHILMVLYEYSSRIGACSDLNLLYFSIMSDISKCHIEVIITHNLLRNGYPTCFIDCIFFTNGFGQKRSRLVL